MKSRSDVLAFEINTDNLSSASCIISLWTSVQIPNLTDLSADFSAARLFKVSNQRIEIKIEGDRQVFIAAVLWFGRKPLGHQYFKIIEVGLIYIPWHSIVLFAY